MDKGSKTPTQSSSTQLVADQRYGSVEIHILKATDQHDLAFAEFEIRLAVEGEAPLRLEAEVNLASIGGGPAGLSEDLAGEPFFDLPHHPSAQVSAHGFVSGPDSPGTWSASGELTLKGVSYPIKIELELHKIDGLWHGDAEMVLDPTALGFDHPVVDAEMVHGVSVVAQVRLPVEGSGPGAPQSKEAKTEAAPAAPEVEMPAPPAEAATVDD
jgi:polyisoprenoid-binding protein YceI